MIDQIGIVLFGCGAVFLSQDNRPQRRRFAPILGLCGQPFWFMAARQAYRFGVLLVTCLYTLSWCRGIWNFWLRPRWEAAHAQR